jgi:hypothetical protein
VMTRPSVELVIIIIALLDSLLSLSLSVASYLTFPEVVVLIVKRGKHHSNYYVKNNREKVKFDI